MYAQLTSGRDTLTSSYQSTVVLTRASTYVTNTLNTASQTSGGGAAGAAQTGNNDNDNDNNSKFLLRL